MTRSTQRDEHGAYLTGDGIYGDWGVPEKYRGEDVDRLAAYENTGLIQRRSSSSNGNGMRRWQI